MSNLILTIIVIAALSAVVILLNMSKKDKAGSKGITNEYTSKEGITRTAKKTYHQMIINLQKIQYLTPRKSLNKIRLLIK